MRECSIKEIERFEPLNKKHVLWRQRCNMPERWTEIRQIDDNIYANRRRKERTQDEINALNNKLKNYDKEYNSLRSHKQFLGKETYGNPTVRSELIQDGLKSSNSRVREAAQTLQEQDTNVKWDKDVREELINICVYIDIGVNQISNWNISSILYKIGKFGYNEIDNLEGKE